MTVVDVHCHTFNADDLPVQGFISRVAFHNIDLAHDLAALVDRVVQGVAPGFAAENARLDALLLTDAARPGDESLSPATVAQPPDLEAEVDAALAELEASEPMLLRRVASQMPASAQEGLGDLGALARRAVRWAKLFASYRVDVTSHLVRTFGDEVDLYTPLLVDLGMGLYDTSGTTAAQQVVLQDKISRLSMRGLLPGSRARIHPFVGFDPRREVQARRLGNTDAPLDLVFDAVTEHGFVGVKLYPPMGFRPIGNEATRDMSADMAANVDQVLREFYERCVEHDVPITAHCNISNGAHRDYNEFSDPRTWARVLADFPGLRLNLGHFGGGRYQDAAESWPRLIAAMTRPDRRLYADVGNHRVEDAARLELYLDMLQEMFEAEPTRTMRDRLMYGSDWLMLAILPNHESFLDTYRSAYSERFGEEAAAAFLGGNALGFLGLDDPGSGNNRRLRKRYAAHTPDERPEWLA